MLKRIVTSAMLLAAATSACANNGCGDNEAADLTADDVAATLRKTFPNYQFQEINTTPVSGLYEVVSRQNIIYFTPETGHLIFGEIWDKKGQNLTAKSRDRQTAKMLETLPLDKAVKIGNGKHKVIEITDPDCPYCRKGSKFFSGRSDVTRYVFFFPLAMHPDAEPKAMYILGADDRAVAYERVMQGELDGKPVPAPNKVARDLLEEHKQIAVQLGVKGTPRYWINGVSVSGANIPEIESLLQQPSNQIQGGKK